MLIEIAKLTDIESGKIFEVNIEGETIILIKNKNTINAFSGVCPHKGARLTQSEVKNGYIICPLHKKAFSFENGVEKGSELCLKTFQIEIKDAKIFFNPEQLHNQTEGLPKPHLIKIKDLPSPKGLFLTGHLSDFSRLNKHQVMEDWVKEAGDLFRISLMGKKFMVSANLDFNSHVLKERPGTFKRFSKIKQVMEDMGIEGVFSSEGLQWKQHRKITAEALSLKNVKAYFPTLKQMTERLYWRWINFANKEAIIDVQQEMMLYTVDITTQIAFGYDTNTLESEGDVIQNHMKKIFPMINKRMTAPVPLWHYYKTKQDREFDFALSETKTKVKQFVELTREKFNENPSLKENPANFLEALLVEQEKDNSFTDNDIFGNVFTMLLAGEDTTSNSISWTLYYLALYPEVKEKLKKEVKTILGNEKFVSSGRQLDLLKYTEAVVLESLRIKPTTPVLIMEAKEDTLVQNIEIPKGTAIILQNKVAQTSPEYFVEPATFIPERWLATTCPVHGNHNPDAIHVFGGGARYCPGKNLAVHEMKMALSMICQNFDFNLLVKPEEVKEIFAFTMYPENLKIRLIKEGFKPV